MAIARLAKLRKRKAKPWHLSKSEMAAIEVMRHDDMIVELIEQREQVRRVMRVLAKFQQVVTEFEAEGG